jgi:hypothetical protein
MTKKLCVVGGGTSGILSALCLVNLKSSVPEEEIQDIQVDYYTGDPEGAITAVGESTTHDVMALLWKTLGFNPVYKSFKECDATVKHAVEFVGWGENGKEYFSPFSGERIACHFKNSKFRQLAMEMLKENKEINVIEERVNIEEIKDQYEFVYDCTGFSESQIENYVTFDEVPVNYVLVSHIPHANPHAGVTKHIATPDGWCFEIPLRNETSIGWLFNSDITSFKEAKENMSKYVEENYGLNLLEYDMVDFPFKSGMRRDPIEGNICYNGNSLFFIEPMEANTLQMVNFANQMYIEILNPNDTADLDYKIEMYSREIVDRINHIRQVTAMHYLKGSIYDSPFWRFAKEKSYNFLKNDLQFIKYVINMHKANTFYPIDNEYGNYATHNFLLMVRGLELEETLEKMFWEFIEENDYTYVEAADLILNNLGVQMFNTLENPLIEGPLENSPNFRKKYVY